MKGVMLDLETMGIRSTSSIASIGAVKFEDYKVVDEFYCTVDLLSCKEVGLNIDASTIAWWKKQSPEALRELRRDNVSIHQALHDFRDWFGPKSMPVWGNGAGFDNVILENAYLAIGEVRPWKYWDDRCYRTLASLFGFAKMPESEEGVKHNALHDARWQTKQLLAFFEE